jgi:hypothetical protein
MTVQENVGKDPKEMKTLADDGSLGEKSNDDDLEEESETDGQESDLEDDDREDDDRGNEMDPDYEDRFDPVLDPDLSDSPSDNDDVDTTKIDVAQSTQQTKNAPPNKQSGPQPTIWESKKLQAAVSRSLDSGGGGDSLSGEPTEAAVKKLAGYLPAGTCLDLGCGSGGFLLTCAEITKEEKINLKFSGIESSVIRYNLAVQLLEGLNMKLDNVDILSLDQLDNSITSVFMNDSAWTKEVVLKSTELALKARNVRLVVCARLRPKLLEEGYEIVDKFPLPLRGGNTKRNFVVYRARNDIRMDASMIRTKVCESIRVNFLKDASSYVGGTPAKQRISMEVIFVATAASLLIRIVV